METVVLSRQWFSDVDLFPLFDKDMIISIMSPGDTHPRANIWGMIQRLDVQFWDVTEEIMDSEKLWRPLDKCHAEMIVDFAQKVLPSCDRLVIHCEAGVSRSPGVAIGLARFFDIGQTENELRDKFPHFNLVVAEKIWDVCEERNLEPRFN